MKTVSCLLVAAAVFGAGSSSPLAVEPRVDYGNANFYIDLVLYNVNRQLPDKIPLPDLGGPYNFKNCFFFGTEHGLRRDGDATLVTVGDQVKFAATFMLQDLGITCDWKYMTFDGSATGSTAKVDIASGMSVTLDHGHHPWLTEFRVLTLEPIDVDVKGLTFMFNWLAEDIAQWIMGDVEDVLVFVIEKPVRGLVQLALNQMVIP